MHYVYLIVYTNGYMYVGSHTWKGVGLDPNYHGSSSIANRYNYTIEKEIILEVVVSKERKIVCEREWIDAFLNCFGIAPIALTTSHANGNYWVDRFKSGVMINCHDCGCGQMWKNGHTSEAIALQVASRKVWYQTEEGQQHLKNFHKKSKSPEALARRAKTIHNKQPLFRLSDGFIGTISDISEHLHVNPRITRSVIYDGDRVFPKRCGNITWEPVPREVGKDPTP